MNLSELFIRRPVMTVLLNAAIVLAGVIAYRSIPVAALPSYDTAVINVSASLPGANPETMASSVALPLEKQFQTIPGLALISSSSTLGGTSLTLEFEEGRDIDSAASGCASRFVARPALFAAGHDPASQLPQGQPGGCAHPVYLVAFAILAALRVAGLCRASDLSHAVHHQRCSPGQYFWSQALRGARTGATRSTGCAQHRSG